MTMTEAEVVADYTAARNGEPRNVVAALARVLAELGGIDKLTPQQRQQRGIAGGDTGIAYAYRGIDQIAGAAQPLLGKYGVIIVPTILESRVDQITVNQRPWTDTWVRVHWTIYGPGGIEDRVSAITEGLGRDNADKGQNKAMTSAAKNLLLRLLMIGDPSDDSDGHTAERDQVPVQPAAPQPLSEGWRADFKKKVEADGFDVDNVIWTAFGNTVPNPLMPEHIPALRDALQRIKQSAEDEQTTLPLDPVDDDVRPVTRAQIARVKAEYERLGYDRDRQLEFTSGLIGRKIDTHNLLTWDEAEMLIEALGRVHRSEAEPDE